MPDHLVHLTDERLRVCLERTVELDNVRLQLWDWPGFSGPLVHVPDPLVDSSAVVPIAAGLTPRYRVMSLVPRRGMPYQVSAMDLLGTLDQFGFTKPILMAEGLGCVTALLVAAWHARAAGLILIDTRYDVPGDSVEARALRECPPDWPALRSRVGCAVLEVPGASERLTQEIEAFAARLT